jgi:hypothetical protein
MFDFLVDLGAAKFKYDLRSSSNCGFGQLALFVSFSIWIIDESLCLDLSSVFIYADMFTNCCCLHKSKFSKIQEEWVFGCWYELCVAAIFFLSQFKELNIPRKRILFEDKLSWIKNSDWTL